MYVVSIVEKVTRKDGDGEYAIENKPINLDQVLTFYRTRQTDWGMEEGFFIKFMSGVKTLYWYYDSEVERDEDYDRLLRLVKNMDLSKYEEYRLI